MWVVRGMYVQMTVEMDYCDWTVGSVYASEEREGYCVVSAKGDNSG